LGKISEQVGRAGRFGTKGLAITFVSCSTDVDVLNNVNSLVYIFLFLSLLILGTVMKIAATLEI